MSDTIVVRHPTAEDAAPLWQLIGELGGLERNTCYAYLLLCTHFASGSLVATRAGRIIGFVLGYAPPSRQDASFVWQVGVHPDARGHGLAGELLDRFVALAPYAERHYLEATVGTSNAASQALFRGFARRHDVPCEVGPGFHSALFAPESHEDEALFRIGPLRSQ